MEKILRKQDFRFILQDQKSKDHDTPTSASFWGFEKEVLDIPALGYDLQ